MRTKIKVCHIVSALKSGGAETMIYNYCKKLPNDYIFSILHQYKASEKNYIEFKEIGFDIIELPEKRRHPIKNYFMTKDYLKRNRIDIVHCHMTIANFLPLVAAKKAGVPMRICHSHESSIEEEGIIKRIIFYILKQICINNATILIACGQKAGDYLYADNPYFVLNNAIDLKKFSFCPQARADIRTRYNLDEDTTVIGHIGRFITIKNQDFLVDVFCDLLKKSSKKYALFLIGDGPEQNRIRKLVEQKGLDKEIIFTGIVNNANDYLSAFDAFVLPSVREGLPVVSLEAQASKLPCFFSDTIDSNCAVDQDLCTFLPLNKNIWIENLLLLSKQNNRNNVNFKAFEDKGFSIDKTVYDLDKIYKGAV